MVGYIYLITDTTNGMKYAGKHHYDKPELDPNYHGSGLIIKSIYKKRPETLKEEYIKTCYSEDEMINDEKHYIKVFNTLYPNGYNLTEGGEGCVACEETRKKLRERHPSEETRKKMSDARKGEKNPMYGKHLSDETKRKIGEKSKGRKSWNKGMKMSDEFKRKNSESHKGLQSGEKNPMYGKHHTEEIKRKLSEARKEIPSPNKGKHLSEETKRKISEARKGKKCSEETVKKLSKQVLQYTLDGILICEWSSIHECERNGFNRAGIRQCCVGKFKQYRGFIWCYK